MRSTERGVGQAAHRFSFTQVGNWDRKSVWKIFELKPVVQLEKLACIIILL